MASADAPEQVLVTKQATVGNVVFTYNAVLYVSTSAPARHGSGYCVVTATSVAANTATNGSCQINSTWFDRDQTSSPVSYTATGTWTSSLSIRDRICIQGSTTTFLGGTTQGPKHCEYL